MLLSQASQYGTVLYVFMDVFRSDLHETVAQAQRKYMVRYMVTFDQIVPKSTVNVRYVVQNFVSKEGESKLTKCEEEGFSGAKVNLD